MKTNSTSRTLREFAVFLLILGLLSSLVFVVLYAVQGKNLGAAFLCLIAGIALSFLAFSLLIGLAALIEAGERIERREAELGDLLQTCAAYLGRIEARHDEAVRRTELREKEARRREYWREHEPERRALEAGLEEIAAELEEIRMQSRPYVQQLEAEKLRAEELVPAEEEYRSLLEQLDELDLEKKRSMPLSRSSREITDQIDELENRLYYAREDAERQKAEAQQESDANIHSAMQALKPLLARKRELEAKRAALEEELNRDR